MMDIRNPLDDTKLIECISGKNVINRIVRIIYGIQKGQKKMEKMKRFVFLLARKEG